MNLSQHENCSHFFLLKIVFVIARCEWYMNEEFMPFDDVNERREDIYVVNEGEKLEKSRIFTQFARYSRKQFRDEILWCEGSTFYCRHFSSLAFSSWDWFSFTISKKNRSKCFCFCYPRFWTTINLKKGYIISILECPMRIFHQMFVQMWERDVKALINICKSFFVQKKNNTPHESIHKIIEFQQTPPESFVK